ncbi:MAG: hydroxysqualene dehydroxylase HpnE [Ignavibacteria bacterium]|nr:hydroxysqualene dehydroxylase HpnE [Ignavibacteria bacterium]
MKKVIIVGGGLAGISAAIHLVDKNYDVVLIESSAQLGGRAKSFFDDEWGCYIDNGQHILINAYTNTIELIKKIGAEKFFDFRDDFEITFRDKNLNEWRLKVSESSNLIFEIFKFQNLNFIEKLFLIYFFVKLKYINIEQYHEFDTYSFLKQNFQTENVINNFWRLVVESALNTSLEQSSAKVFLSTIKKMFLESKSNANIILPKKSLHESLINPAENFLNSKGVRIIKNYVVNEIKTQENVVSEIKSNSGETISGDYFILAVHPSMIGRLIKNFAVDLNYQTIINVHFKLENQTYKNKFFALWNSEIHWAFFHENILTAFKSSANDLLSLTNDELVSIFIDELIQYFPELRNDLTKIRRNKSDYRIIKIKRATFMSDIASTKSRPKIFTDYKNLFLAGDYIETGLPSTIESAVFSGKMVAEKIISNA